MYIVPQHILKAYIKTNVGCFTIESYCKLRHLIDTSKLSFSLMIKYSHPENIKAGVETQKRLFYYENTLKVIL